jgi:predicted dehydrogenase
MHELKRAELTAVCDNREAVVKSVAEKHGARAFTDPNALISSGLCDAVLVATPHLLHPPIALAAMKAGLHVMSEKPMAVRASDADRMIAEAKKRKVKLGVMFQRRTESLWKKAKEIVDSGALGELVRTCVIESYFRPQSYYDCGQWRGTYAGEGGGVLVNQFPHSMDRFLWLGGMPCSVIGKTASRGHKVEVEDLAVAVLEYPNGAVGQVYTSTYEFPEPHLYQFAGDRATLEIRDDKLRLGVSTPRAGEMLRTWPDPWGLPMSAWTEVEVKPEPCGPRVMTQNFVDAILDGAPLIAPGEEGVKSVEVANAIIASSALKREVTLPLNRKLYDDFLAEKTKTSKMNKPPDSDKVVIPRR